MGSPLVLPTFELPKGLRSFVPPSMEDITSNPAYQLRLKQGEQSLQRAAAAKGVLRTGGTLKDILGYGQDLASEEFDKQRDRAFQEQQAARDFAFREYDVNRQNALDQWRANWEQYQFANQPRGGGGGGYDIPPPPMAPDIEDPGADPYAGVPDAKRRNPKFPGYDPYY